MVVLHKDMAVNVSVPGSALTLELLVVIDKTLSERTEDDRVVVCNSPRCTGIEIYM